MTHEMQWLKVLSRLSKIWCLVHVCQQKHPTPVTSLKHYDIKSKATTKPESDKKIHLDARHQSHPTF